MLKNQSKPIRITVNIYTSATITEIPKSEDQMCIIDRWQRMWIAEELDSYKRHLAATLFADVLQKGQSQEAHTGEKHEPGATVDYSVRVYMINGNQKEIIYNAYHESEAKIDWVDNTTVSINGKTLDMSSGETYDWRKE